jgi:hypothetical protein
MRYDLYLAHLHQHITSLVAVLEFQELSVK